VVNILWSKNGGRLLLISATVSFLLLMSQGCTKTENGIVFGTPAYEKRDIKVSKIDLEILLRTKQLLGNESKWDSSVSRTCQKKEPFTLYCALEAASIYVIGEYRHRQAALQEVRFAIDDKYSDRWSVHRLADFNAHSKTTFNDIKSVLNTAIATVNGKLAHNNGN
jgi:hypothetical protein